VWATDWSTDELVRPGVQLWVVRQAHDILGVIGEPLDHHSQRRLVVASRP